MRVPNGMQTNGTSCSIATSATAASEPSPPAIPSTSAPACLRHLGQVVSFLEEVDGDAPLARGVAELLGTRRVRAGAWVDDEESLHWVRPGRPER